MKQIDNSLIVLGDSFSDCDNSWADMVAEKIGKPIVKYTISGGSNDLIFHKFMSEYTELEITNSIILFQSTVFTRVSVDISPMTYAGGYMDAYDLRPLLTSGDLSEIAGRTFIKQQFSHCAKPHLPYTPVDYAIRFYNYELACLNWIYNCNLFNTVFNSGSENKFAAVLGLYSKSLPDRLPIINSFLRKQTFPIITYTDNILHMGLDQYVIDMNEVDDTMHPTSKGNQLICDNLVLPKLKEWNYV
jgi:hypothetical protein